MFPISINMLIQNKRIFYINSRNRMTGDDSDFTINLNFVPQDDFDKCVILQMTIPKSYYQIEAGFNTFVVSENGTPRTITIPPGNFNRRSLQVTLQTLLNGVGLPVGWNYVISYPNGQVESDTGKYTFTVSGNSGIQPQFIFSSFLFELFGFDHDSTNVFVANALTSTNVIKLIAEDTLYLHSDCCTNGVDNILQEVFTVSDPTYASIVYQCIDVEAYSKNLSSKQSNGFRFYLTDEDSNKIDLNGLNMQFVLMLYKEDPTYSMIRNYLNVWSIKIMKNKIFYLVWLYKQCLKSIT